MVDNPNPIVIRNLINETDFDEISLSNEKVNAADLLEKVISPKAGAVASFFGTTRETFEDKMVESLEYEAYASMALSSMSDITSKARQKWDLVNVVIVHKLGQCPISNISVGIVVSSVHRRESLEAVNYLINELKDKVPIWKKEIYSSGDSKWKSNKLDSAGPGSLS